MMIMAIIFYPNDGPSTQSGSEKEESEKENDEIMVIPSQDEVAAVLLDKQVGDTDALVQSTELLPAQSANVSESVRSKMKCVFDILNFRANWHSCQLVKLLANEERGRSPVVLSFLHACSSNHCMLNMPGAFGIQRGEGDDQLSGKRALSFVFAFPNF